MHHLRLGVSKLQRRDKLNLQRREVKLELQRREKLNLQRREVKLQLEKQDKLDCREKKRTSTTEKKEIVLNAKKKTQGCMHFAHSCLLGM